MMTTNAGDEPVRRDVLVIGAGFGGLYMIYRLRELGLTFEAVEMASDVGGTWYWNRYPGARCDVVSLEYSYSFDEALQQEWEWTERYATQPEILRYANHVADRFDLRRHIRFNTRVTKLEWDDDRSRWRAHTDSGPGYDVKYVITAVGCLSAPKPPEIDGVDDFRGTTLFTSMWPHEGVDFTGKRVGVIGTGSSGVQSIPVIAQQAEHLTVFQRTPVFSLPARNAALDPDYVAEYKRHYAEYRRKALEARTGIIIERGLESALEVAPEARRERFESCWNQGLFACLSASYTDIMTDERANTLVADFVRSKIAEIVHNPSVAEDLMPQGYPYGAKRVCLDSGYYDTFNRTNVDLVNLRREPIARITETGIRTSERDIPLDAIVFATGFDAITGPLLRLNIRGRGGLALEEKWAAGPRTYLGLQTNGFPNLFTITGPGSPSVVSNMIVSIEQHVDWIARCLRDLRNRGVDTIEPDAAAEDKWVQHVNDVAAGTLYPRANSWFMGANVPGKPRVFMPYLGGVNVYRETCEEVAADNYRGFVLGTR
ncbi:NAD(P)/FAD-dependent oxidoreductase [Thermopolyspora sp. NPDC052614]|uniref:flavin-containing monooxygenase n=1 Tax=Thermopolyspora sp. NPDC052614 TaxID=3155682 RepID=UPI0034260EA3